MKRFRLLTRYQDNKYSIGVMMILRLSLKNLIEFHPWFDSDIGLSRIFGRRPSGFIDLSIETELDHWQNHDGITFDTDWPFIQLNHARPKGI